MGSRNPSQQTELDNILASLNQGQSASGGEIDSIFNPLLSSVDQFQSNLESQKPGLIAEAEAQAKQSQDVLAGNRDQSNTLLGQQSTDTENLRRSNEAQQRQTFQELGQANAARFGGSSSAGQAASELQGREFQRSTASNNREAQVAIRKINNQKMEVERTFQNKTAELINNLVQAKNGIQRTFQDKMAEINSERGRLNSEKAQAKISAIAEFRNSIFKVNLQKAQFEQDMALQRQQDLQYLNQASDSYLNSFNSGQDATNQYGGYQTPGISKIQGSSATDPRYANYNPTGQISSKDERLPSSW